MHDSLHYNLHCDRIFNLQKTFKLNLNSYTLHNSILFPLLELLNTLWTDVTEVTLWRLKSRTRFSIKLYCQVLHPKRIHVRSYAPTQDLETT